MTKQVFIKPPCLKRGDTVGIVAPAWSIKANQISPSIREFHNWGLRVKYSKKIFLKDRSLAGCDRHRARQINDMFADKSVKAIFCAKAGYGSIRTIPYLDEGIIRKNPKIFIGYSDITILLAYLQKISNMVVFHGPILSGEIVPGMNHITKHYLLKSICLKRRIGAIEYKNITIIKKGRASGVLTGGNMSLLVSSLGTPYEIDTDDKILFLEEINEDLEVIDNIFVHLKLAGKLKKVRGVIFGKMVGCYDNLRNNYNVTDTLKGMLKNLRVPVISGFPSGHSRKGGCNITLPLGVSVTLDAGKGLVIINESAVK